MRRCCRDSRTVLMPTYINVHTLMKTMAGSTNNNIFSPAESAASLCNKLVISYTFITLRVQSKSSLP